MSDITPEPETDPEYQEDEVTSLPRDWFLAELVRTANNTQSRFPITLAIPGGFVSGVLVSGREYFERFSDQFSQMSADEGDNRQKLKEWILSYGWAYQEEGGEEPVASQREPQFIHLVDAKYFHPGSHLCPPTALLFGGET